MDSIPSIKQRNALRNYSERKVFIARTVGQKVLSKRKEEIVLGKVAFP